MRIAPKADLPDDSPAPELLRGIETELKLLRTTSQRQRYSGRAAPVLPSRAEVAQIAQDIVALLYPRHFGPHGMTIQQADAFVGATLRAALPRLSQQITLELALTHAQEPSEVQATAAQIVAEFGQALPHIRAVHDTDIAAAFAGDPSAKSLDEVIACFPSRDAVLRHRIAHRLHSLGAPMIARMMAEESHAKTGIDIHPGAKIGPACFIDHGTGVVIGETAVIGRNLRLYQNVTLGAKSFETASDGSLIKGQPRHPIVEDDVVIYAGATVLGRITIGRGSVIGGGVWLTHSVPAGSSITQAKPQLDVAAPKG